MSFQKIVLLIATVILIIVLTMMAVMMSAAKNNLQFAPEVGTCPDYFDVEKIKGKETCVPIPDLIKMQQKAKISCVSPIAVEDIGSTLEKKKQWANSCNLTWDGITNLDD